MAEESSHLVAFVDQLMSTGNGLQPVDVVELCCDLITKQPASATWTDGPRVDVLWITPYKITERSLVGDLLGSRNDADLVDGPYLGTQTAVYAQNSPIDDSGKDQEVKDLTACLPH